MTIEVAEEIVDAEIVRTFEEHAEIVGAHHEAFKFHRDRAAEEAILTGQALLAAKNDLGHGKWIDFLPAVGMKQRYAHKFMRIGVNLNQHNCADLPGAVATLYELSRMDPGDIEAGIESGAITPKMTIKEARDYAKKEKEVPAPAVEDTRAHKSPFAEGTKLTPDTDRTVILVGADGRAYTSAPDAQKAIDYARENPRAENWEAARGAGVSTSTVSRAYAALRKNGEIPATGHTERSMADMFDLIAIGARNVGTSIDMYADRIGEADPDDFEYYWEEFDQAVKKISGFRREIKRIHNI